MAKVLGILVLLVLLILGAKIALAGFAFLATAASFMTKATGVAIFGVFAVGVFTVARFALKKRD